MCCFNILFLSHRICNKVNQEVLNGFLNSQYLALLMNFHMISVISHGQPVRCSPALAEVCSWFSRLLDVVSVIVSQPSSSFFLLLQLKNRWETISLSLFHKRQVVCVTLYFFSFFKAVTKSYDPIQTSAELNFCQAFWTKSPKPDHQCDFFLSVSFNVPVRQRQTNVLLHGCYNLFEFYLVILQYILQIHEDFLYGWVCCLLY